ncbi:MULTISPECIES: hypothetical protein [unclassified Streptomyces]|uniref:hypothetical protein n=1 Tax=unclassified Streptomyces TaxID=2593676 RepID=UPI00382D94ED
MDLLDWHRERLSARRLAVLIKQLPRDSALNRELHGEAAEWSVTDHLLAAAVDHLAAANWMFACVNSEEGDQPEAPAPVPRPADLAGDGEADDDEDEDDASYEAYGEDAGQAVPGQSGQPGRNEPTEAPSASQLVRFFG